MGAAGILRRAAVQAPDLAQAVAAVYAADVKIAGVQDAPMSQRIDEAVRAVAALNA